MEMFYAQSLKFIIYYSKLFVIKQIENKIHLENKVLEILKSFPKVMRTTIDNEPGFAIAKFEISDWILVLQPKSQHHKWLKWEGTFDNVQDVKEFNVQEKALHIQQACETALSENWSSSVDLTVWLWRMLGTLHTFYRYFFLVSAVKGVTISVRKTVEVYGLAYLKAWVKNISIFKKDVCKSLKKSVSFTLLSDV